MARILMMQQMEVPCAIESCACCSMLYVCYICICCMLPVDMYLNLHIDRSYFLKD